jgi:hypothetical protein
MYDRPGVYLVRHYPRSTPELGGLSIGRKAEVRMELDFTAVLQVLQQLSLGGISLALLVVVLTEVVKEFAGIQGKAVRAVALGLGFVLAGIAYGLAQGLIPESAGPYIQWFFVALVGGLGSIGLWHLGVRFLDKSNSEPATMGMIDPDGVRYTLTAKGREQVGRSRDA